ncbi:HD domain-containing protein [Niabella insulamsoli]|uniref:HD domain-containing protein n=1 Tax=Niabella insulamsoli TaxID=3144874 RepID=UPI0031FDB9E7
MEAFADEAHGDQTRKYTPDRYIVHPVRVMKICSQYTDHVEVLAAALLHDVLEDTPIDKATMQQFLNGIMNPQQASRTVSLVVALTDVYVKKNYPQLNRDKRKALELRRIEKTGSDAQTIKYADILDNSAEILQYDRGFGKRFLTECKAILTAADQGDPALRGKALEVVNQGLDSFRKNR